MIYENKLMINMTSKFTTQFHMSNDRPKENMNCSVLLEHNNKGHKLNSNQKNHFHKGVITQILSANV
jgi:hypothetical protein